MLESHDLTRLYGGRAAVDHVTLSLEPGHIYAMMGPNGSGKTTWMKMAAGLVKPSSGAVTFNGSPVGIATRAHIAYMSTEPCFYDWMTVRDAGRYYADFFRDFSPARYEALLARLGLDAAAKIKSLSTGMTAKLKLGVTLARDAAVFMLDEPFNGIDLLARDELHACILDAAREDRLFLISSHLVEEMETLADRAVFLSEGRLIEQRDLEEMRETEGLSLADRYRQIYGHTEVNA